MRLLIIIKINLNVLDNNFPKKTFYNDLDRRQFKSQLNINLKFLVYFCSSNIEIGVFRFT